MTDEHRPRGTGVEGRLRQTLREVAEREPVADAFDQLRGTADAVVVSFTPPPRVTSRRTRWLAVAAAVVVLATTAGLVLAAQDGGDETQVAGAPEVTGWYLPEGLDTTWELLSVTASPVAARPGLVRTVEFLALQEVNPEPFVRAEVFTGAAAQAIWEEPKTPPGPETAQTEWIVRGDRRYRITEPGAADATPGAGTVIAVRRGPRVMVLESNQGTSLLVAMADRWWESEGQVIEAPSPDTVPFATSDAELFRTSDDSAPTGSSGRAAHTEVRVVVRSTERDLRVAYHLVPTGAGLVVTGIEQPDGGAAAGLAPEDRPRRLDDPDLVGPAWEVTAPHRLRGAAAARFPGADVFDPGFASADGSSGAPSTSEGEHDDFKALLADLRPATAAAWADAVRSVDPDPDPALLSPTLGGGSPTALPPTTTEADAPGTATSSPPSISPPDASAPDASETDTETVETETETETVETETETPETETEIETETGATATETRTDAEAAAAALVVFAEQPSDATFAALPLADDVIIDFGVDADPDSVVMAAPALRDSALWEREADGAYGRDGRISPLDLISGAPGHQIVDPSSPEATCGGQAGVGGGTSSAAIASDVTSTSCLDWFAVIIRVDGEGRITHVLMRLYEP